MGRPSGISKGGGDELFRTCQREVFEAEPAMATPAPSEGPVRCLVGMAGIARDSQRLPLAWAVRGKSGYGFSGFEGFRFLQPFVTTSFVIAELPESEEVTAENGENASSRPFFMCFTR